MLQTVAEIYAKVKLIVGIEYSLPKTSNKGRPGLFLEELLDIPHTQNCLDCLDGELKLFPTKKLKDGTLVPKESIAITMLSENELRLNDFNTSKCCNKMSRMLLVPYFRTEDNIQFMMPKIIDRECIEFAELYNIIELDYMNIKHKYIETGNLLSTSNIGTLLQNRTKGAGHGSTSRAFYIRPLFMKQYVPLSLPVLSLPIISLPVLSV